MTLSPEQADLLGGALSFAFTVALLSYLFGDNPLYRVALHLFIGVAIGYAVIVVGLQVILPRLVTPLLSGDPLIIGLHSVPLLLFIFLIMKLSPRTSALGNLAIAYMIGVGTAVAIGGTVTGTLLPQVESTWLPVLPMRETGLQFVSNAIIAFGTITTLLFFQFWLRGRSATGDPQHAAPLRLAGRIGQGFIVLTLGVIYGGMILSGIAIFSRQVLTLFTWASGFAP